MPLLMTGCHQIGVSKYKLNIKLDILRISSPECTKLHRFAHILSKTPQTLITGETTSPLPIALSLFTRPPSHFFRASACADYYVTHNLFPSGVSVYSFYLCTVRSVYSEVLFKNCREDLYRPNVVLDVQPKRSTNRKQTILRPTPKE